VVAEVGRIKAEAGSSPCKPGALAVLQRLHLGDHIAQRVALQQIAVVEQQAVGQPRRAPP